MAVTLCLCGDVMTGRGIDQVLHHPCNPVLYEDFTSSAEQYVRLAERASGPISRGLEPSSLGAMRSRISRGSGRTPGS